MGQMIREAHYRTQEAKTMASGKSAAKHITGHNSRNDSEAIRTAE
jgi:hypothetical protein